MFTLLNYLYIYNLVSVGCMVYSYNPLPHSNNSADQRRHVARCCCRCQLLHNSEYESLRRSTGNMSVSKKKYAFNHYFQEVIFEQIMIDQRHVKDVLVLSAQIGPEKPCPSSNKTNIVGQGITVNIILTEDANVLNFVGSFILFN